ncbi:MAG: RNA polymerase sigma factor [Gemmatimonadaceae bacterium]
MEVPDTALIQRVLGGDTEAYALLVARYYDRYARFAVNMLGNREDAEEALQDAFVRAYRSLGRYENRERFGAWLFRILVNRCRTTAARRRVRERVIVAGEEMMATAAAPAVVWDGFREELARALVLLAPEQREAFLLKHVEDLSYEEMSVMTGVGVSALKMRVQRACARLRDLLREVPSA